MQNVALSQTLMLSLTLLLLVIVGLICAFIHEEWRAWWATWVLFDMANNKGQRHHISEDEPDHDPYYGSADD